MVTGTTLASDVNVEQVGHLGGYMNAVSVVGNYAYVVGVNGLKIVDISNPSNPIIKGTCNTGSSYQVAVAGQYAYVVSEKGLMIVDISNPSSPIIKGKNYPLYAADVAVDGKYAYVVGGGLYIVDISNPSNPTIVGHFDGSFTDISISGKHAYCSNYAGGFDIIDISSPSSPTLAGSYDLGTSGLDPRVAVSGNYAYFMGGSAEFFGTDPGFSIIDISNPSSPTLAKGVGIHDWGIVTVSGNYAYIGYDGVDIVDVSNPYSATIVGSYVSDNIVKSISVSGNYVYVVDDSGLVILNNVDSTPEPEPADMRKDIKVLNVEVNDYGEVGFVQLGDEIGVTVTYQNLRGTLNAVTPEVVTCYISGLHSGDKIYSFDPVQLPIPAAGATREETIKVTLPANNLYLTLNSIQVELVPANFEDVDGSNNHGVSGYFLTAMTQRNLYENLLSLMLKSLSKIGVLADKFDTLLKADPKLNELRDEAWKTPADNRLAQTYIELKVCSRLITLTAEIIDNPVEGAKLIVNMWIETAKGVLDLGFGLAQTANLLDFIYHESTNQGAPVDMKALWLACPADIQITGASGNVIRSENGMVVGSSTDVYMVVDGDEKRVLMFNDSYDGCKIKLMGTDTGTFNFSIYDPKGTNYKAYNNVPVNSYTVCSIDTSNPELSMSVDSNGDGITDQIIAPNTVPLEDLPPTNTQVPEFTSVVIPVVAVLGIIAIIGRRKE